MKILRITSVSIVLCLLVSCQPKHSQAKEAESPEQNAKIPVLIEYADNTVKVSKPTLGIRVSRVGMHVVAISNRKNVEFILKGATDQGSFKLYSDHSFVLRLAGVQLSNPDGSAINIQSSRQGVLVLEPNSENILKDGALYDTPPQGEQMNACLFSKGNVIFYGSGKLLIKGNFKHAICCKGSVKINEHCDISILEAKKDGLHVTGDIIIEGGKLNINVADDGLKVLGNITINDGDIAVRALKKDGSEGLECSRFTINGGKIRIVAYDDAINTIRELVINGGSVYCYSLHNDGIDSNGSIQINGGLVISSGTHIPEEGIDCDRNPFVITGGTIIASGGGSSLPTALSSTQPSLIYSGADDQSVHIRNAEGEDILTYVLPRSYRQYALLFSSPELKLGQNYALYAGGEVQGGAQVYGYYIGADYHQGVKKADFTTESMLTMIGELRMGGPMHRGAFPSGQPEDAGRGPFPGQADDARRPGPPPGRPDASSRPGPPPSDQVLFEPGDIPQWADE